MLANLFRFVLKANTPIMEVTSKNFDQVLQDFPKLLKKAQFLTLDTEFTGLQVNGAASFNYFDTLNELYALSKSRTSAFLAIQYGICLFQYHPKTDTYSYNAFNFYIYPRSSKRNFSCQVSCMQFLCEHGLDFNKLFRDGITYLTKDEMNVKLEALKTRQEKSETDLSTIPIPKDQKHVIAGVMEKMMNFMNSSDDELLLPRYNAFLRRLIYQTANEKYSSLFLETLEDGALRITKGLSAEEKKERQNAKYAEEKESIIKEYGFSQIIEMIVSSRKLVVGHNVLVDLLYTVNQFLQPLPDDFEGFREMLNDLFPNLIDTKYAAIVNKVVDAAESSLFAVLKAFDPEEIPAVKQAGSGKGYERNDVSREHEAAYDAYVTGLAFLAIIGRIGKLNMTNAYKILPQSPLLEPFVNKLSVPLLHEISYMDIGKQNPQPKRTNVFHIRFPADWKQPDILNHFNYLTGYIKVRFIDGTSAFMGVTPESAQRIKQGLQNAAQTKCVITTYNDFRGYSKNGQAAGDSVVKKVKNRKKRAGNKEETDVLLNTKKSAFDVPEFE